MRAGESLLTGKSLFGVDNPLSLRSFFVEIVQKIQVQVLKVGVCTTTLFC